ncbi:MAG: alpha amylase N-terminal ig-like domain-containing protein [Roseburia sp.]
MDKGCISHRAAANECYALDSDWLVITMKTGYDVAAVYLCYGDPFSSGIMGGAEKWSGERVPMEQGKQLALHQLWTIRIRPEYKRCKYYFEIHGKDGETVFYLEDGCYDEKRMSIPGRKEQCFFFPWMNPSDLAVTPDWVADTVWYQIFPDRFCNGGGGEKPFYTKKWTCKKTGFLDVYGGDINGIRSKIPYLKELGITGLYLTPIFAADSNHKYNTTDYRRIDKCFGTEEDIRALVKEAHEAGIRIMLDAVFNHSGQEFAPWMDVVEKGPESDYYDWFFVNEWPFPAGKHNTKAGNYYAFAFADPMPKLNTNNPQVVQYFTELCSYWLKEWGIDGIRFDVGNEVAHSFLKQLHHALKSINPEVYLLGEIWHDSIEWLRGDEYDSVMNYPFSQSINDFYIDMDRTAEDFCYSINRCYSMYFEQTNRVLFNLLDSHDTERLFTRVEDNPGKFYQQLAVLFTMQGSPCIFYGTEIAMPGGHDPDCRRCMPWEQIEAGAFDEAIGLMKTLISIRKSCPACKSGTVEWRFDETRPRLVWYEKKAEDAGQQNPDRIQNNASGKNVGVILNATSQMQEIDLPGEVLFSYGWENRKLAADGVLIYSF